MNFHPRASEERLEGFSQAFRHSLEVALLWFRSGEEQRRERESDGGPFSPVCCLQSAVSIRGRSSGARGAYQACRFSRIHRASTCVLLLLLLLLFFSLLLSHGHFGDRSAVVNTEEFPPSALSGLCFHFSPPPLIRSVGLLF